MIQKELLNELSGADHRRDVGARRGAGDRCVRWEDSRFGGTGCGAQAHRGKGEEGEWEEEGEGGWGVSVGVWECEGYGMLIFSVEQGEK